jgi:hypothetical protein
VRHESRADDVRDRAPVCDSFGSNDQILDQGAAIVVPDCIYLANRRDLSLCAARSVVDGLFVRECSYSGW